MDDNNGDPLADDEDETNDGDPHTATHLKYLYAARFFSTFKDRLKEFAIPVLLITIWSDTFAPGAVYAFIGYACCILAMPRLGRSVGFGVGGFRMLTMKRTLHAQNACAVIALLALYILCATDSASFSATQTPFLCAAVLLCGTFGGLAAKAGTIAMEKEWLTEMVSEPSALSETNASLRRIDLCCKILAPLIFGLVVDGLSVTWGAVFAGMTYVLTWWPECRMLELLYASSPVLSGGREPRLLPNKPCLAHHADMWLDFRRQSVFLASLACGMIYATVLTDGGVMTQFFVSSDASISLTVIAIFRGVGAFMGIVGTYVFPHLRRACGDSNRRAGGYAIGALAIVIVIAVVVFRTLDADPTPRDYLLLSTVALSRGPLWIFDLCMTQLLQENVAGPSRGMVSGCHVALYTAFSMVISALAIVLHRPSSFMTLAYVSASFVASGAVVFNAWS
eukprot:g3392.t1